MERYLFPETAPLREAKMRKSRKIFFAELQF